MEMGQKDIGRLGEKKHRKIRRLNLVEHTPGDPFVPKRSADRYLYVYIYIYILTVPH